MINIPEVDDSRTTYLHDLPLKRQKQLIKQILNRGECNKMAAARRKWESTIQEEPNDFVRGKYQESRQSKITRVNKLYTDFLALSKIEKINFINLIKNYG